MKRFLSVLLSVCLVVSMLAGCTKAQTTTNEPAAPVTSAESAVVSGEVEAIDNSTIEARDVLRVGDVEEWYGTDLIQCDTFLDLQMTIAEPLFLYDRESGSLVGCLAETPTFNDDGTVMTFKVPEGRYFPNGAELGADDVVASIWHGINDGYMSDTYANITDATYEGNEVTLTMTSYSTALMILLVSPFFCVIDTEQLETMSNEELLWGAVPYGPYYITEYVEGASAKLARNDGFKTLNPVLENKGAAYIPNIEVTWYTDEFAMIAAYEAGDLDLLIGVHEDTINALQGREDIIISASLPPTTKSVQLNANHEFLNDKRVRTAISYLIDRAAIVAAFGGDMMCTPQYEIISENVQYRTPAVEDWFKSTYCDDPDKGVALLAEAGWTDSDGDGWLDKDGQKMPTLTFNTGSGLVETCALTIQMTLKQYGIDTNVVTTKESTSLAKEGAYDLTMASYWWSEPARFLVNCFKDHNDFDETEYRAIVDKVEHVVDNDERFQYVEEAQRYLLEQMVVLPLFSQSYIKVYDKSLANIHFICDGMFLNDIK
ncbi:MAG: ABC transporter substrate-binding protein [Clostridia bacterium]|nr:ABC transporter substrate-binding protein [Clostridia bacterium]